MSQPGLIQLVRFMDHPPARVWRALTDPALVAQWWAAGDVKPVVGHRFTLDMGKWGRQPCEVVAVEPERLLSYTFASGTLDTVITWKLQPQREGTLLSFEQRGFDLDSPLGRQALEGMGAGWPRILERMGEVLSSGAG